VADPILIAEVALVGLGTTSSVMAGAALGLYVPIPSKILAGILAFAAGSLIAALAIDLAFQGANDLVHHGTEVSVAWLAIAGGFGLGAVVYYASSLFLEKKGAAIRYPSRFQEYARDQKRRVVSRELALLARCTLLRHLPPEEIERLLERMHQRTVKAGEMVFRMGDPGDALYLVAKGGVDVLRDDGSVLAQVPPGQPFGEMALLSDSVRTASVRARLDSELLVIGDKDFDELLATYPDMHRRMHALSHERALANLRAGGLKAAIWAQAARDSLANVSRGEERKLLQEAGQNPSAGLAIVFGNILDTIPGCLVIGAEFHDFRSLSITLILGMFLGGIPEAAASATMLAKAGFSNRKIFLLWSSVLAAGIVAAAAGQLFIGGSESSVAVLAQAVAGGAILALITHAMIPEALHKGGSAVVLPVVAGFVFALYLALVESMAG
jgi:CRP-like cAMP-binding protein